MHQVIGEAKDWLLAGYKKLAVLLALLWQLLGRKIFLCNRTFRVAGFVPPGGNPHCLSVSTSERLYLVLLLLLNEKRT